MSGLAFPNHVLGRGRQWDGILLTDEVRRLFWPGWHDNDALSPPLWFFDLYYDDGSRDFYVITEQGSWHEVSELSAKKIIEWLQSEGLRTRSLERIQRVKLPRWGEKIKPERPPRDESGNRLQPSLRAVTSPGREKSLRRRLVGKERNRDRGRRQARRQKFNQHE